MAPNIPEPRNQDLRLTMELAKVAPLPESGDYTLRSLEDKTLGLGLRVHAGGSKQWVVVKWSRGSPRKVTLGKFPGMTLEGARMRAREVMIELSRGLDPNQLKREREVERRALGAKLTVTVAVAFEEYLTAWEKKAAEGRRGGSEKTRDGLMQAQRLLQSGPIWKMPALELSGEVLDVEYARLLDLATRGSGQTQATNTFRWLRAAVLEAAGRKDRLWKISAFDELASIRPDWNEGRKKTTIVGQAHGDLKRWWQAVEKLRTRAIYPESAVATADLLQLTILFGNRVSELLTATWDRIDFERRLITLFASKATGDRKDHVLPFGRYAHAILRRRRDAYQNLPAKRQSGYIFWSERPQRDGSYSHLQEPKKGVAQVAEESGIAAGMHDLRRTVGSLLSELGVPEQTLKKVLNHAPTSVADAHYVITRLEPFRAIFQRLEDTVLAEAGVQQLPPDEFSGGASKQDESLLDLVKSMSEQIAKLTAATTTPPPSSGPFAAEAATAASPAPGRSLSQSPGEPAACADLSAYDITYRKSGDTYIVSTQINGKIVRAEGDTLAAAKILLSELLAG